MLSLSIGRGVVGFTDKLHFPHIVSIFISLDNYIKLFFVNGHKIVDTKTVTAGILVQKNISYSGIDCNDSLAI